MLLRDVRLRALSSDPHAFGSTYSRESAFTEASWAARAKTYATVSDAAIFLAFAEERPIGIVRTDRDEARSDVFGIFSMWVAPEARRRGVAAALLARAEEFARTAGGRFVELDVVDTANAARLLYASFAYRPEGSANEVRPGVVERRWRKSLGT